MKKMQKILIPALCFTLLLSMLSGCKKEQAPETEADSGIRVEETGSEEVTESAAESEVDATMLENEGDVVIVIPDDQEEAGE